MGALVVLALLQAACVIAWAYGLSHAVSGMWSGLPVQAVLPDIVLFAVCFVGLQVVRFAQETMLDRYARTSACNLRSALLDRVFAGREALSVRIGAAKVASLANDGIDEVQTYVRLIPPKILGMAAISVPLLVFEFAIDWVSGIILLVMFPVIMFFMVLLGRQAKERSQRQYAAYTRLTNRFMDTLRGLPVLKAFGAVEVEAGKVYANSEAVRHATVRTLRTATLSSAVLDLCATFGVAAVAIMLAFRLMDGSLPLFTGLLALVVAPEFFAPIRSFAGDYHASLDGKNALAELLEHIGPLDGGNPLGSSDLNKYSDEPAQRDIASMAFESLTFENVGFQYDDGTWGVRGVSGVVGGSQKIGVIGKSGAGKSTMANLLAGFVEPTEGRVLVDGEPVDLSSKRWRRMVRYIPQNPYIFRATLEENICFYYPAATRKQVEDAVHAVGLDALVDGLSDGLDTLVGEGARGLSGGEAHRVALARVLVDDQAKVLVFDEPTAHLDIETERDLKAPMLAAMEGRLVLFATHRLHWMGDMDCMVSLEQGRARFEEVPTQRVDANDVSSDVSGSCAADAHDAHVNGDSLAVPSGGKGRKIEDAPEREDAQSRSPEWFKGYVARYKGAVAKALGLGFVTGACAALLMFTSGYLISATAVAGVMLFAIMIPVACVQLFGLGRPLARYLERLASHDWVLHVTSDLRLALYRAVARRVGDPSRDRAMGEYLGILADDVAHLQNLYLRVVFPTAIAYLLGIGASLFFGWFSLSFAAVVFLSLVVVAVVFPMACLASTRKTFERVKNGRADEYTKLADDVYGAIDWLLAGRGTQACSRHERADTAIRVSEERIRLVQRSFSLASVVVLSCLACAILVWSGQMFGVGWGESAGAFDGGVAAAGNANWIAAFALGFFPLIESFVMLPGAFSEGVAHRAAVQRLDGLLGSEVEDAEDAGPADCSSGEEGLSDYAEFIEGLPAFQAEGSKDGSLAIELRDVSYAYPGSSRDAVHDMTLEVPCGEAVAVLGRSGAGKSTFAALLRGVIVADDGGLCIRGAGYSSDDHEDGSEVILPAERECLSRLVGYVGQTPYLFNRSLRDNLTLGVQDATDEQLLEVLRAVGLEGKVGKLSKGLDTVIGETGTGFSGGEAHRVAIARVLLSQAPIVLVDEPFSALDPETERDLLDTLIAACEGRTLIVITHHLAEINRFDRVVFIGNGHVELEGAPEALMQSSPRFKTLVGFDR